MIRIRIVEEDYGPGIWGSYIDVKVKDDEQELKVLDLADRRIKRKAEFQRNGKPAGDFRKRRDELRRKWKVIPIRRRKK